jgi:nucleoside-diphosphate-sugar epimerase
VNPTILVTGGCGFIGTWVLRELQSRSISSVVLDAGSAPERWNRILGAAASKIPLVQGSLLDRELVRHIFDEHQITHVIHLAALLTPACQRDPWEGCQVNVLGTVSLFEEARRCADRIRGFAYASSVAVYGDEPDHAGNPANALRENRPETFYGAFKKAAEGIAYQYWKHHQIHSVGIRPQVAYGPERDQGMTAGPSLAARAAASGQPYTIPYRGRIGYDYAEDVARSFVRAALETPPGAHVVDLESTEASVEEIVAAIEAAEPRSQSKIQIQGTALPAFPPPIPCPISTLFPDWKTTPLIEGIQRTVDFYRDTTR